MSEEFGSDFVTISDEDGTEYQLEHLDTIELDDTFYMFFVPADVPTDDDRYGLIILKSVTGEDGEDYLDIPEPDEEKRAYEEYMKQLFSDKGRFSPAVNCRPPAPGRMLEAAKPEGSDPPASKVQVLNTPTRHLRGNFFKKKRTLSAFYFCPMGKEITAFRDIAAGN